jgi:hypothetical protein
VDTGVGALVAGEIDQRLVAVHAHDVAEPVGQGHGVTA